ncbi:DUF1398 family protein [Listeria booriae]|uniref:DUF1398 family protein n=1 Tax=Listeria booriae TaxID=1552123 RepID=UPI00162573A9|nr:DUF1398 family protein [Listeria booriae]MBC1814097.1 DUF1398 family protein [Listeria booriae]
MKIATSEANAGNFPKVVQGFKAAGVTKYDYIVATEIYVLYDAEGPEHEIFLWGQLLNVGSGYLESVFFERIRCLIIHTMSTAIANHA